MKRDTTAHFDYVKLQNKKIIRNLLRGEAPQSIAALAEKSGLSYPTVSNLLKELTAQGEALVNNMPESCGGRPGIRYELNPFYQSALILCFEREQLLGQLLDYNGAFVAQKNLAIRPDTSVDEIIAFLKEIKADYPSLSVISIGIPGVSLEQEIVFLPIFPKLVGKDLALRITEEIEACVFLENDLNAIALAESDARDNFSHIAYIDGCVGVGIVHNGEIIRGCNGFAGELEYLNPSAKDPQETLVQYILALVCVLNQPEILISGSECSTALLKQVHEKLSQILPQERIPRLTLVSDIQTSYIQGLKKRILMMWQEE